MWIVLSHIHQVIWSMWIMLDMRRKRWTELVHAITRLPKLSRFLANQGRSTWLIKHIDKNPIRVNCFVSNAPSNLIYVDHACHVQELVDWTSARYHSVCPSVLTRQGYLYHDLQNASTKIQFMWIVLSYTPTTSHSTIHTILTTRTIVTS